MSKVTTRFEVWNGLGEHLISTTDEAQAYSVCNKARVNGQYARVHRHREWSCGDCGATVYAHSHDASCDRCDAQYNVYGQRLNRNWRSNMSNYDENVGDMEGMEEAALRAEAGL